VATTSQKVKETAKTKYKPQKEKYVLKNESRRFILESLLTSLPPSSKGFILKSTKQNSIMSDLEEEEM